MNVPFPSAPIAVIIKAVETIGLHIQVAGLDADTYEGVALGRMGGRVWPDEKRWVLINIDHTGHKENIFHKGKRWGEGGWADDILVAAAGDHVPYS